MRDSNGSRHFDIDGALDGTAKWLAINANRPLSEFKKLSNGILLTTSGYTLFFKAIREDRGSIGLVKLSESFK